MYVCVPDLTSCYLLLKSNLVSKFVFSWNQPPLKINTIP